MSGRGDEGRQRGRRRRPPPPPRPTPAAPQTPKQTKQDLAYSPDGRYIAAWDSVLSYRVVVYTESGECVANYSAYADALGVRSVAWSPPGDVLAVGSYDQARRRCGRRRARCSAYAVV